MLDVVLVVVVSQFEAAGQIVLSLVSVVPLLVLWLFSLTAWADVDADGVRWRCFRTHDQPWTQIERVRLGALFVKGSYNSYRPAIMVAFAGRERSVMPTYGCSRRRLFEFTEALAGQAFAHGVPVYVDSAQWAGIGPVEGLRPGPPPGPRLERSPIPVSVQVRLFVLALPVIGVLGLVGGITGWDTTGLGERIAVGIVGGLLLLVGVLLVVVFFAGQRRAVSSSRLVVRDRMR